MKKILLFAFAVLALTSCTNQLSFDPNAIAEQCMSEHAYHPDELKVLSCNAVLRPERTKLDTFYHISSVEGLEGLYMYEWHDVKSVTYDSVRIEKRHFPEHYYCCATIECVNDCGETVQGTGEVAVFHDGSAILYKNYRDCYYKSVIDTIYAQRDTLTDVREHISYMREWNGWLVQQMLLNYHAPTE